MGSTGPTQPLRVLSVPAGHPYVEQALGRAGEVDDGLLVLPDVIPPGGPAGQWWPLVAFDPDSLPAMAAGADVMHVHFGFEGIPPTALAACAAILRRAAVPLVLTVHDLQNPHGEEQESYAARLGRLVQEADALVTLTPGAAAEIQRRWGREALVLPHPHVAPLDRIGLERPAMTRGRPVRADPGRPLVGVDLKSLRANVLRPPALADLSDAVHRAGATLRIGVHEEALEPGFVRHDPALMALLNRLRREGVDVRAHRRYDDDALLDHLAALDAMILPYRFGTHSGYLEACRDVGTAVVAPAIGNYRDQHDCPTYDPDRISDTLPPALRGALLRRPEWAADRLEREREAARVRAAHRGLYARLVADSRVGASA